MSVSRGTSESVLPPWLQDALSRARKALEQDRLAHGLLLYGPPGWGEVWLANALALLLLDEPPERNAATLAHPDLRWLAPESAGAQIKIDEIRSINEFAVRTAQISPRKVVVVAQADRMNAHAANALLKTLEEPPGACYLLLTTTTLAELLPTIRSRCQLLPIKPADAGVARAWLNQQSGVADAQHAGQLAFEYGFAAIEVLEALDREEQPLLDELTAVRRGRLDVLTLAARWARLDVDCLLARWMRYARALQQPSPADIDPALAALSGPSPRQWQDSLDDLLEARAAIRSTSNPNARLMLEGLLLHWRAMFTTE